MCGWLNVRQVMSRFCHGCGLNRFAARDELVNTWACLWRSASVFGSASCWGHLLHGKLLQRPSEEQGKMWQKCQSEPSSHPALEPPPWLPVCTYLGHTVCELQRPSRSWHNKQSQGSLPLLIKFSGRNYRFWVFRSWTNNCHMCKDCLSSSLEI